MEDIYKTNTPNIFLYLSLSSPQKRRDLWLVRLKEENEPRHFLSPLEAALPAEMKRLDLSTEE